MNVHKRCQKNVANNCGINSKQLAETLNAMGISGDKLNRREKKSSIGESPSRIGSIVAERSNTSPLPSTAEFSDRSSSLLLSGLSTSDLMVSRLSSLKTSSTTSHREQQDRNLQSIIDKTVSNLTDYDKRIRKYTLDDFKFIKVLGKGSFGKVSTSITPVTSLIVVTITGNVS